jgi:hypothetical protein
MCPYYQRGNGNREKGSSCTPPGFPTIHRLK